LDKDERTVVMLGKFPSGVSYNLFPEMFFLVISPIISRDL